jgi:Zn-dependent protease with chaperone function
VKRTTILLFALLSVAAAQGPRQLKPGWNLFSKQQDIQLGKEAAAEIEKQVTVVNDAELSGYIQRIGQKLAATPEASDFPYSFKLVSDKAINAFALPGGPTYVHTGLIAAAENEAQLAGVMAHEIAHVALRHGTNQASKANLIQLPAMLAGALAGGGGSMLGQLTQLGIGLGANSVLLKFSRSAERDADLLGARMMAKAGYNPIEMARFFEKLEAEGGGRGPEFLSSHPNPGNRVKAVEAEVRYLPSRTYTLGDARAFTAARQRVSTLPPPPPRAGAQAGQGGQAAPPVPQTTPSARLREFKANSYSLSYPENWQASPSDSQGATIAPKEGVVESGGGTAIGIGAVIGFHSPANGRAGLRRDTDDLVRNFISTNAGMSQQSSGDTQLAGKPARIVTLHSNSPFSGTREVDTLITVDRPEGLFYLVLIAPQSSLSALRPTFDAMIRSLRFAN